MTVAAVSSRQKTRSPEKSISRYPPPAVRDFATARLKRFRPKTFRGEVIDIYEREGEETEYRLFDGKNAHTVKESDIIDIERRSRPQTTR